MLFDGFGNPISKGWDGSITGTQVIPATGIATPLNFTNDLSPQPELHSTTSVVINGITYTNDMFGPALANGAVKDGTFYVGGNVQISSILLTATVTVDLYVSGVFMRRLGKLYGLSFPYGYYIPAVASDYFQIRVTNTGLTSITIGGDNSGADLGITHCICRRAF